MVFRLGLALLACVVVVGCTKKVDSKFATPEATIQTMFTAYGVQDVPEQEIRRRLENQQRFKLFDAALVDSTFADLQSEADQGLAGFVFGRLVAAKDSLAVQIEGDLARVSVAGKPDSDPIVMQRTDSGWKFVLQKSVPDDVRQRLYGVYQRSKKAERNAIHEVTK